MRLSSASTRFAIVLVLIFCALFAVVKFGASTQADAESRSFIPILGATKTGSLLTDANGNGFVNPGDSLRYLVTINNTGPDPATGVAINDTIDANTTLIGGSVIASAVAVNDTFSSIGNVGISVPDGGSDLLANDFDANNPGAPALVIVSPPTTSTQGGQLSINPTTGAFTYNPPPGFEGADTFTYTLSNGTTLTDTATVTINISGMIWFINNASPVCTTLAAGCGRLSNPFSTLAAFQALNNGTGNNPADNDNIFVYESATGYPGGVILRVGQKLIGQDSTSTLATISGVTVPTFSNALPAMNSGNLVFTNLTGTTTLNTNTVVRGLRVNSTNLAGINDPAGTITGVNISEIATVTTTTGTAVLLSDTGGTISITSISANGAANGISLTNTTGSFTVTGSGNVSQGGDNSGGTIQSTTGNGISLNNVANPSFNNMNIQSVLGHGVFGTNSVTNFSFTNSKINNVGDASGESCASFSTFNVINVAGTFTFTNNQCTLVEAEGVDIKNFGGTISNATVSNNVFTDTGDVATAGSAVVLTINSTSASNAVLTRATLSNNSITDFRAGAGFVVQGNSAPGAVTTVTLGTANDATNNVTISGNLMNGGNGGIGNQPDRFITSALNGRGTAAVNVTNNGTLANPIQKIDGVGIELSNFGPGTMSSTVSGNRLAVNNAVASAGIGIGCDTDSDGATIDNGTYSLIIDNNNISQTDGQGIFAIARNSTCTINTRITNNTAAAPATTSAARSGIQVSSGSASGDVNVCMDLRLNTTAGSTNTGTATTNPGIALRKQGIVTTTNDFGIEGLPSSPAGTPVVENYVNSVNTSSSGTFGVGGTALLSGTSGFIVCSAAPNLSEELSIGNAPTPEQEEGFEEQVTWSNLNNSPGGPVTQELLDQIALPQIPDEFDDTPPRWHLPFVNYADRETSGVVGRTFGFDIAASSRRHEKNQGFLDISYRSQFDDLKFNASTSQLTAKAADSTTGKIEQSGYTILEVVARIGEFISPTVAAEATPLSGETVNKALGTSPPGENIRVQFDVTVDANIPTNDFSVANTAQITSTNHAPINSTTATTTVVHPPTLSKAFGAANIALNGTTTLTFTIGNANPATAFTNVAFSDTLPAGMVIATPNGLINNCGGGTITATQGTGVFSVSALARPANSTCTIVINVLGTTDGVKNNLTGTISSTEGGTGLTAAASVNVITAPSFTKAFGAATIPLNGSTSLSFTITNNSPNSGLSGVGFTDTLPAGLVVATPNGQTGSCGGGTITATPGAGSVSLSGAALAASANCTFSVNVTGTTAGVKNNSVQMSSTQLGNGATANASVTVVAPPTITKAFSPTTILQNNGFSTMTITITNPNAGTALSGVGVVDPFPAGMEVDTTPTATNTCGGTFTPAAGNTSITLSGGSIAASGNCAISVRVRGTTAGAKLNTTNAVTSVNGGDGLTASATLTVTNTATWSGATSANWATPTNWTLGIAPISTNDVDIPAAGVTNNPIISAASVTVNNLTEAAGRTLTINSGLNLGVTGTCTINGTLTVAGSFSCGTLAGTGTVNFTGAAAQNIPALTYNNLTINNAAGTTLLGNTTVNGVLTLTSGNINTGANTLTIGPSGSISRTSGHVVGNLAKIFTATGPFTFHVGTTGYSPLAVDITALAVNPSTLTVSANDGTVPPLPDATTLDRFWSLTESGDLAANLLFTYLQADVDGNELAYRTIRVSGGVVASFPNVAPCPGAGSPCVDPVTNTIKVNGVTAFSEWTAGELAPTAAAVGVSGRVVNTQGRGVSGALVTIADPNGTVRYATTNQFGFYRFLGVTVGETYLISVQHKSYQFAPRIVSVNDEMLDVDFVPIE